MIWSNRIVPVLAVVSMVIALPGSARASDLSEDDWDMDMEGPIIFACAVCVAVGVITAWCGVKSLTAVRRKHIEAEEQGLTFTPVLIEDGAGRLGPGIQVSWSF